MYKDTTKKDKGVYKRNENEQDYFSVEFYAETYARNANIKLVNTACTDHNECGSKCCVPYDANPRSLERFCQIKDDLKNQENADLCQKFEDDEVSRNIARCLMVSILIVIIVLMICKSGTIYKKI